MMRDGHCARMGLEDGCAEPDFFIVEFKRGCLLHGDFCGLVFGSSKFRLEINDVGN